MAKDSWVEKVDLANFCFSVGDMVEHHLIQFCIELVIVVCMNCQRVAAEVCPQPGTAGLDLVSKFLVEKLEPIEAGLPVAENNQPHGTTATLSLGCRKLWATLLRAQRSIL